eukprot:2689893-Alexandrium_andersonii.AAC.1
MCTGHVHHARTRTCTAWHVCRAAHCVPTDSAGDSIYRPGGRSKRRGPRSNGGGIKGLFCNFL